MKRSLALRWVAAVAATAVAIGVVVLVVVGSTGVPSGSPRDASDRIVDSGVALSSPIDPDARFYWELSAEPEALIPLDQIISGGPPPDGIPAIDQPRFVTPAAASEWLQPNEPVISFELNGDARAYPIQILTWHEIVNDVVAGEPVAVTFCPLCNSAIVFDRRVDEELVLDFGTSGRLFKSDLVMYDRQTKSLWPQIDGQAVVGSLIGTELEVFPATTVSWEEWRTANPEGKVLSRDTGFSRNYGVNPYEGYDRIGQRPFLFQDDVDGRLPATERVVAVEIGGQAAAYPFGVLEGQAPVAVHDSVGSTDIVVFFEKGTSSALDAAVIAEGRDVGAAGVYLPTVGGRALSFEANPDGFVDRETGTTWSLLGKAVDGPLAGESLEPVSHVDTFWFAWAAFQPETVIWSP